ncbi:hypothetical protein [Sphingobacterium siyangense]|uniref:hypothetical protein n=1 Tax=Sphingobacterium siyangense TaxID=459529 RepID=UPI003C7873FE
MKNLLIIFTLFLGLGAVNAQTKTTASKPAAAKEQTASSVREQVSEPIIGPTKEETVKYLHGIIKNIGTSKTEYLKSVDVYTSEEEKYTGATLEGCNLIITLFWEKTAITPTGSGQSKGNKTITIPMDKIEKINKGLNFIKFSYYQGEEMIKSQAKFDEVNNVKSTKITEGYSSDFSIIGYENEDVFNNLAKALDHLRKL